MKVDAIVNAIQTDLSKPPVGCKLKSEHEFSDAMEK